MMKSLLYYALFLLIIVKNVDSSSDCALKIEDLSEFISDFTGIWRLSYHRSQLRGVIQVAVTSNGSSFLLINCQNGSQVAEFHLVPENQFLALAFGVIPRAIFKYIEDGAQVYILSLKPALVLYEFGPELEHWNTVWSVYLPESEVAVNGTSLSEDTLNQTRHQIGCVQNYAPEWRPIELFHLEPDKPGKQPQLENATTAAANASSSEGNGTRSKHEDLGGPSSAPSTTESLIPIGPGTILFFVFVIIIALLAFIIANLC